MKAIGITGTDTGVGKTTVGCAILSMLAERGVRAAAMKPVETGVSAADARSDAARLMRFAGARHEIDLVRPYRFEAPLSPLAAAEQELARVSLDVLDDAFLELRSSADVIIVEGAGGALVPLTESVTIADLFHRWSLGVIIVAANRLGVLNHTLLTERALRSGGCSVHGIVLVDQERADDSAASNAQVLARLTEVRLARFPWLRQPDDPRALVAAAEQAGLDTLLDDITTSSPLSLR